jgi:hypothetical protein
MAGQFRKKLLPTSTPSSFYKPHDYFKMLYLVGLGLSDEADITVKGLEIVRKASRVYLEAYTSILLVEKSVLVCKECLSCFRAELTLIRDRKDTMDAK